MTTPLIMIRMARRYLNSQRRETVKDMLMDAANLQRQSADLAQQSRDLIAKAEEVDREEEELRAWLASEEVESQTPLGQLDEERHG